MYIDMETKLKCPKKDCKSTHVVSHGTVVTVNKGKRQRYKCQDCGHTFYVEGEK
jgi:transposase-like protein